METIKVSYDEFMFLQCRTSDYHFISDGYRINIDDSKFIANKNSYYLTWQYGGRTKANWFTIEQLEWICKAHAQWLGKKSHSYQEWNSILEEIKKVGI